MKKNFLIFALVASFFALTLEVAAQKNKTTDTPVTSTILDADGNSIPYSIHSDFLGSYKNGVGSVVSRIQGIGDWELDMLASPSRRLFVDFGNPVSGNDPARAVFQRLCDDSFSRSMFERLEKSRAQCDSELPNGNCRRL